MGLTGASKAEERPRQMAGLRNNIQERKKSRCRYYYDIEYEKQLFLNSLSKHQEFTNERKNKKQKRKSTKNTLQKEGCPFLSFLLT